MFLFGLLQRSRNFRTWLLLKNFKPPISSCLSLQVLALVFRFGFYFFCCVPGFGYEGLLWRGFFPRSVLLSSGNVFCFKWRYSQLFYPDKARAFDRGVLGVSISAGAPTSDCAGGPGEGGGRGIPSTCKGTTSQKAWLFQLGTSAEAGESAALNQGGRGASTCGADSALPPPCW